MYLKNDGMKSNDHMPAYLLFFLFEELIINTMCSLCWSVDVDKI